MLKTVSSITNAIGALNFKGTWNASTNTPTLASGVGTKGDYFVVGVAGTTTLDGISTWGVGDWATYNGSVWQRVEGGADLEGVNLNVSGTTNLAALTASTALALDASKNVVSVTNTGTGNNVLGTSPTMATPTLTGDVQMSTGNLVIGTSGKGIDFSATPGTGTSELLDDYEEGTWTPVLNNVTYDGSGSGNYIKIGQMVYVSGVIVTTTFDNTDTSSFNIGGLPFASDYFGRCLGHVNIYPGDSSLFTSTIQSATGLSIDSSANLYLNNGVAGIAYNAVCNASGRFYFAATYTTAT